MLLFICHVISLFFYFCMSYFCFVYQFQTNSSPKRNVTRKLETIWTQPSWNSSCKSFSRTDIVPDAFRNSRLVSATQLTSFYVLDYPCIAAIDRMHVYFLLYFVCNIFLRVLFWFIYSKCYKCLYILYTNIISSI